jgi:hypothetical protein
MHRPLLAGEEIAAEKLAIALNDAVAVRCVELRLAQPAACRAAIPGVASFA